MNLVDEHRLYQFAHTAAGNVILGNTCRKQVDVVDVVVICGGQRGRHEGIA